MTRGSLRRLLALTLIGVGCRGTDARSSRAVPEVNPARLEEHIRYLASDKLGGRGTGTSRYDSAARYVAKHFAALGLDSAGTEGYLQRVPLLHARVIEGNSLVLVGKSGRRALIPYRDYVPFPDFLASKAEVTAPLVFAGVTALDHGYDDYRAVDPNGKIVVLLTGAPSSFPPAERAHHAAPRMKRQNAARKGAIGALVVRTRDQSFPWDRLVRQFRRGGMRWLDSTRAPADVSPTIRGAATLSDSAAAYLFEGAPQSVADILTGAETGNLSAFDLPVRATIRTVSVHDRLESPNVVGLLRGSDPRLREEVLVYSGRAAGMEEGRLLRANVRADRRSLKEQKT